MKTDLTESEIKLSKLLRKNRAYREKVEALVIEKTDDSSTIKLPAKNPSERKIYFLRKNTKLAEELQKGFRKLNAAAKAFKLKQSKPRDLWLPAVIDCPTKIQSRTYSAFTTKKISIEAARDFLKRVNINLGEETKQNLKKYKNNIYIRYTTGLKYQLIVENHDKRFSIPATPWVICLINNIFPTVTIGKRIRTYKPKINVLEHILFHDETRILYFVESKLLGGDELILRDDARAKSRSKSSKSKYKPRANVKTKTVIKGKRIFKSKDESNQEVGSDGFDDFANFLDQFDFRNIEDDIHEEVDEKPNKSKSKAKSKLKNSQNSDDEEWQ